MIDENESDWPLIRFLLKRHTKKKLIYYSHEIAVFGFTAAYCVAITITGVKVVSALDAAVLFTPLMYVYASLLLNLRDMYEEETVSI